MAFEVWLIAVIAVGGFLCCTFICYIALFFVFVNSRNNVVKVLSNLHYIPDVITEKEIVVESPKKLSKRQLRRKRMRETDREMRLNYNRKRNLGFESDSDGDEDNEQANRLPKDVSTKVLSWVATAFSSKSSKIHDIESGKIKKRASSKFGFSFSSKSESVDSEDDLEGQGSSRSKRFISLDRLQRREARSMLVKPKAEMVEEVPEEEEEVVFDTVVSLLSLAVAKKKRVTEIMENRKLRKEPGEGGVRGVDVVALNAGPTVDLVPTGYELVPQSFGPLLVNPDFLIYKRILYLWDGSVSNIKGWFIGTVVGISENTGFNFRIKYDREETKSIFVDGIQPVFLSLSGEHAFGRRWVALQKMESVAKSDNV